MKEILKYFPGLDEGMRLKFEKLYPLYREWNEKINVISRKDIDNLYTHHVLHSLAIAKYRPFEKGSTVLDVGTGGGFPGIPLAILYPECRFTLADSIGKKIMVVSEIAKELGLENTEAVKTRVEEMKGSFDYVVSRAVTELSLFYPWVKDKYKKSTYDYQPYSSLHCHHSQHQIELRIVTDKETVITHSCRFFYCPSHKAGTTANNHNMSKTSKASY